MATASFKEDLFVQSAEKTNQILTAMQKPKDKSIVSKMPPKLPENAGAIWFNHLKK